MDLNHKDRIYQRDRFFCSHPGSNKATFWVCGLFCKLNDNVIVPQRTVETLVTHNLMGRRQDCQWAKIRFVPITEVEWTLPLVPLQDTAWMLIESQQGYGVVVDWHSTGICLCQPNITQWSDSAESSPQPSSVHVFNSNWQCSSSLYIPCHKQVCLKAEVVFFLSFCLFCCHHEK